MEKVRVGTAVRDGTDFILSLGELLIGGTPEPVRRAAPAPAPSGGDGGEVFPPYGRSKGMPVRGATMTDLEYYANGSRRSLADPTKARWHDKERQLLAAIEAEIERQGGGGGGAAPPARGGGYGAPPPANPYGDEGPPPLSDDDIPF